MSQVSPGRAYPIARGALLPRRAECTNLVVPVAVSASHIAYGSIRMEPVFMILGQSAATMASLALEGGVAVQDVPWPQLRARLLADGQPRRVDLVHRRADVERGGVDGVDHVGRGQQRDRGGDPLAQLDGDLGHGYVAASDSRRDGQAVGF